jgi:hypothetical protein
LSVFTKPLEANNEYLVGDFCFKEGYEVIGDPLKETVVCKCRQFDRIGILCGHALKVLDLMNIKSLPPQYVLKRLTREARNGPTQDNQERNIIENPMMGSMLRYRFMSHKFQNLAHRTANFPDFTMLVDSTHGILAKQIEDKIGAYITFGYPTICTNADPPDDLLSNARLKTKEIQARSSKRKKTWLDKNRKFRKKKQENVPSQEKQVGEEASNEGSQEQVPQTSVVCC